jgi:hypothetical protein
VLLTQVQLDQAARNQEGSSGPKIRMVAMKKTRNMGYTSMSVSANGAHFISRKRARQVKLVFRFASFAFVERLRKTQECHG